MIKPLTAARGALFVTLVVALTFAFTIVRSDASDRDRGFRGAPISTSISKVEYYRLTGCMVTMTNGKQYRGSTLTTGNSYHIWWTSVPKRGERQDIAGNNADLLSEALSLWEEKHVVSTVR